MKKTTTIQIFLPTVKDANPFLDDIIYSSQCDFHFGDLNSYEQKYPVVLINWPEQLFNWKEPTGEELQLLEEKFKVWQQKSHIVYIVHNFERHYGMTPSFKKLYNLVIQYSKSIIHFGRYSEMIFKKKYPNKQHQYIPHPLYTHSFSKHDKIKARQILGISSKKIVIIAPGTIRNNEERGLITKAFDKLKEKEKLLLVPKMFYKTLDIEFKGRTLLKKVIDIKKKAENLYNENYKSNYKFTYDFTPIPELSLMMSAADIVLIPRIKALNSGNVFLGLTYNKIITGPGIGNIKEVLESFNLPVFNPNDTESITRSLEASIKMYRNKTFHYDENKLKDFSSKVIAEKWDRFIKSIS